MTERRVFRVRFEKRSRITFGDDLHEMTIRRRRDPVREDTVRQLSRALGDGTLIDPETVRLLGLNLYELIFFNAHANEWFERVYEAAGDLRLVLEFQPGATELMAYPWEFLFVPESRWKQGGRYLLKQARVSLVRRVIQQTTDPRSIERPRFLVVDCLPAQAGVGPATSEAGRQCAVAPSSDIDQLMAYLEASGDVRCMRFPSQIQLMEEVGAFSPDVVHLTGHGRFQAGDGAAFEFCMRPPATGELERWETDERIAEAIGAAVPELVLLHTCKGGAVDRYESYEGAAVTLVKRGVPNVVALQHEIPLREATRFVTGFYEALAQGWHVERAVREGRQALRSGGVASFGLPVAYVQRSQSFALPRPAPASAARRPPAESRAGQPGTASPQERAAHVESAAATGLAEPRRTAATPEPTKREEAAANPLSVRLGRRED